MSEDWVRRALEDSPYGRALGVRLDALACDCATLRLPFQDANANPGGALHGGCAASLAAMGAQTVAGAVLGDQLAPFHTAAVQVSYLAAAISQDVVATARLLRRGKSLCFVEVDVATSDGKPIAHATATVRGRAGAAAADLGTSVGDDGAADPGPMGPFVEKQGFMAARKLRIENMSASRSRLRMPCDEANQDVAGGVHEGALLALLDTTGAMASWAQTGPGRYKASTPSLQAQMLAPCPKADLVAYGRVFQRDGEIFWSDAEVAEEGSGRIIARGTVLYRIVT